MLSIVLQLTLAFIWANLVEWIWHKYIFHGYGKKKTSSFSGHWREHHKEVRKSGGLDLSYKNKLWTNKDPTTEVVHLVIGSLLHLPFAYFSPIFVLGVCLHSCLYYYIHRKSHLDIGWAKRWAPWHYDHHMGKNQDANWCVTPPLWDYILRTRVHFLKNQKNAEKRKKELDKWIEESW